MNKKLVALLCAVMSICCIFFVACGDEAGGEDSKIPVHYPVIVGGCEIPAMPQKVVSLSPSVTDMIAALGLSSKLVGVSGACENPSALPLVGSAVMPDCDKIIELGANVVLVSEALPAGDAARMETHNIKVAVIPFAASYDKLKQNYLSVASVFAGNINGKKNADVTIERYTQALTEAKAGTAARVAFIMDAAHSFTPDTLVGDLLSRLGATNVAAGTQYGCDAKQIAAKNPEVIYCFKGQKAAVTENENLKETDAVKNGKVFEIDNLFVERQGEQVAELIGVLGAPMAGVAASEDVSSGVPQPESSTNQSK